MRKIIGGLLALVAAISFAAEIPKVKTTQLDRDWLIIRVIRSLAIGYDPNPKTFKAITKADEFTFDMILIYEPKTARRKNEEVGASVITMQVSCKQKKAKMIADVTINSDGYEFEKNNLTEKNGSYTTPPADSVQEKVMNSICNRNWPDTPPKNVEDNRIKRNDWI